MKTYKMTTPIPESITAPDKVETSLGTLEYFDGVPKANTVEKVYDYLDRAGAVEAFLNCIPVMSMYMIREGQREAGQDASNKVLIYDTLADSKSLYLTQNTSTMYAFGFLDLEKDGPTVVELPPRMLGILDDMAFLYMVDLGMAGPDKGKGGNFLVLPPGYDGEVPDGYFVVPSNTYGLWLFMRGYLDKGVEAAAQNIRDNLKVYPLAKKNSPPPMEFINASGMEINTVVPNDFSFFEKLHTVIQEEPAGFLGPELSGQVAAIGLEKGKPFPTDQRMLDILRNAADIGNAAARAISYSPRHPGLFTYGKDSGWYKPMIGGSTTYMDNNGARVLDGRIFYHFGYVCVSPAMSSKSPGKGSDYSMGMVDAEGRPFDGSKTYKLRMPPDIPVKDFWALTLYDTQTRCLLQTDQQFPTLDSYGEGMKTNADGSIDVYFAPEAPKGQESNWLQTIPGKSWFVALRMYGPLEPWLDQTWRPGEIELIE
jgi:hypothetical protein